MSGKCADQRIDQNIQILPEVVSGLHRISAVAVDESRQIGGYHLTVLQHIGSIFKITDP